MATSVFLNEFHYDNDGTDTGEFIEIAGPAGTDLTGWILVLYNGNGGAVYGTFAISGTIADLGGGFGTLVVTVPSNGLQNGSPDGIALVNPVGQVIQFLSYEGNFAAVGGQANGLTSTDIGVSELGDTPLGKSLQLGGTGTIYEDFTWSAPADGTPGLVNAGQSFVATPSPPTPALRFIHEIQGSAEASPLLGQAVTIEAIVIGDFQNGDGDSGRNLGGFYVQEENADADGNALTSEGIFVFEGGTSITALNVGDKVRISGTVGEFSGETQLQSITAITAISSGNPLPTAALISLPASEVTLNQNGLYQPELEAFEGMRVEFTDTLTISELFQLDRFNEIRLVQGERPQQFTQLNAPDAAAYAAYLQQVGARTIVYDDGLNVQNAAIGNLDGFGPAFDTASAPRMGDTISGLEGVLSYQWAGNAASGATWRVRSAVDGTNVFEEGNPRPATPPVVGGSLKVASFNVLNFFATIDGSTTTTAIGADPRGADDLTAFGVTPASAEFERQKDKLVTAILGLEADILGLVEIENDFLSGSTGNAIEVLVDALNAVAGPGRYAWVDPGPQFVGDDAIAVGFLYDTQAVGLKGDAAILATPAFLDPNGSGESRNRAALAQTFEEIASGEAFTAVVNHFKAKGASGLDTDPTVSPSDVDQGDGQGYWNDTRSKAAQALATWLETDPTGSTDEDILILGDLNAYAKEDPITYLESIGYTDLARLYGGDDVYSYVFDGQVGTLDYALANPSLLAQVTGAGDWHINADEADGLDYNLDFGRDPAIFDGSVPSRTSDHDPVVIGLALSSPMTDETFTLQLLHFADGEAGLLASQTAPNLAALVDAFEDDFTNTLILAGGDNFLPGPFLAAGTDPSVIAVVGKGDNPAAADIEIHNRIGVEASTIGNHEFDLGTRAFSDAVGDAAFPYLSANLEFSGDRDISGRFIETVGDTDLENVSALASSIVPSAVVEKGGELIGLVGATTQILETISSTGGVEVEGFAGDGSEVNDMALLAQQLQPVIDDLRNQGVDKIILMAHLQQIALEQELATLLNGVDIILAAGSNTRLGDSNDVPVPFPGHAADFANTYPIVTTGSDGGTTLIVNTDNEYTYLGRLVVEFDADGNIIPPNSDNILGDNTAINGAYAATAANVAAAWGVSEAELETTAFVEGTKGEEVADITEAVQAVITAKDGEIAGFTNVYLEGERNQVRNQETNLGNLTADAQLEAAQDALGLGALVVSLKNGGGIRAQIGSVDYLTGEKQPPLANPDASKPEGAVSTLDIENSLRFNNELMIFDTTPTGLKAILEHGVAVLGNQGRFPQVGGVSFSFDPDLPAGSRVINVAAIDDAGNPIARIIENGSVSATAPATITVVTINFLADGGDAYPIKANGENFRYLLSDGTVSAPLDETLDLDADANTPTNALGEQQALRGFLTEFHATSATAFNDPDTATALDERIQNLDLRSDNVFPPVGGGGVPGNGDDGSSEIIIPLLPPFTPGGFATELNGDDADNELIGNDDTNYIRGLAGQDTIRGFGGNDDLRGNQGDDVISAGQGDDNVLGGTGNDTINGNSGNDVVRGGYGDDLVQGGLGDDALNGNSGADVLLGGAGDDVVNGGQGDDRLNGNGGDDLLIGGSGSDFFLLSQGDDTILDFSIDEGDRVVILSGQPFSLAESGNDLVIFRAQGNTTLLDVSLSAFTQVNPIVLI
jgi:predicted extracellular nuclease/2',3'-cyclic-nucleotide 2'-phosphodiesterase (5'-nucleotidase family)